MSEQTNKTSESRRKFIKTATAAVYVAPLVVTMEAKANIVAVGSKCYNIDGHIACE